MDQKIITLEDASILLSTTPKTAIEPNVRMDKKIIERKIKQVLYAINVYMGGVKYYTKYIKVKSNNKELLVDNFISVSIELDSLIRLIKDYTILGK